MTVWNIPVTQTDTGEPTELQLFQWGLHRNRCSPLESRLTTAAVISHNAARDHISNCKGSQQPY